MMMSEFSRLTGIYPDGNLYTEIESAYMKSDMDKETFCERYLRNVDGLAQLVQFNAATKEMQRRETYDKTLNELKAEVDRLNHALEREQEWKPLEPNAQNYTDEQYEHLKKDSCTEQWSDDKAKDYIYIEFGFAPERVKILHDVPRYDVNRHRLLRERERVERLPLYSATDWNYIRFDVGGYAYECQDGELRKYYQ